MWPETGFCMHLFELCKYGEKVLICVSNRTRVSRYYTLLATLDAFVCKEHFVFAYYSAKVLVT